MKAPAKRRGRPAGSKNKKAVKVKKEVNPSTLVAKIDELNKEIANLKNHLMELENQNIGYEAIIDFLEFQLQKRFK